MSKRLVLFVVLACLVCVLALPAVAYADVTADNAACLSCHSGQASAGMPQADFSVGPVDRSTACTKCHWIAPHPRHYSDRQCLDCHANWDVPTRSVFYNATIQTPAGYFSTPGSAQATAAQLHEIHTKRSWPADLSPRSPVCSSCHAAAACDACHSDVVSHGSHQVTDTPAPAGQAPRLTRTTKGMLPADAGSLIDRTTVGGSTCAASSCHSGLATHDAVFCNDSRITYVGDWVLEPNPDIIGQGMRRLYTSSGSMEVTISGTEFTFTGYGSPYGGYGVLYVDGAPVRTLNFYSAFQADKVFCWVRGLAPGEHTVRLENAGFKMDVSRGYQLAFQLLDARTQAASFSATPACTNCHDTLEQHYGPARHTTSWDITTCIGSGCHTSPDLSAEHKAARPGSDCTLCHGNTADPRYAAAIAANDTSCGACHDVYAAGTHRTAHWPTPLLADASGPHYGYYTGSASLTPTNECLGCHTSNLVDEHMGMTDGPYITRPPRYDATGNALDCASCHSSANLDVLGAIATGTSACETCHVVHAPTPLIHASDFTPAGDTSCVECHSSDLTVVHDGDYAVTTASGKVLTGCAVCHEYYEGERGAQVQYAIDVANDTSCTACHADYHAGATPSHTADDAASIACADCHGTSGQPLSVTDVHATAELGKCAVCHNNPTRVPDLSAKTAECASCHATEGTDYHLEMAAKHLAPESAYCQDCHHHNPDVTAVHGDGCTTCHNGTVVTKGITTKCTNCHTEQGVDYHPTFAERHASADTASAECAGCHKTTDVRELHVTDGCATCHNGNCADCHSVHSGSMGMTTYLRKTTACANCHATSGTDYHTAMAGAHTYTDMPAGCVGANCHAANTLPEAHTSYLSRYPDYATTCALCHQNTDPDRIDWDTASADCSTCHTVHADVNAVHTATAPERCFTCHKTADAFAIHKDREEGECAVCHANPTKGDLAAGKLNTNCDGCHTTEGTDFHAGMNAKHRGFTGTSGCDVPECHGSIYVPQIHERFVGQGTEFPQYADSCELCHLNDSSTRINWTVATGGTCSNCHPTYHQSDNHTATSAESAECVACHGSNWVPIVHDPTQQWEECNLCHYNPEKGDLTWDKTDSDCEQCHNKYPAATNHYAAADHTATEASDCAGCHKLELAPEHIKASSNAVDCLGCHKSALFSAMPKPWGGTCAACHTSKHGEQDAKHASTTTACAGAGCHDITDVAAIHDGPKSSCASCHTNDTTVPTTTTCTDCHDPHGDLTVAHTAPESQACVDCHETADVRDLHGADQAASCAYCHNATVTLPASAKCVNCHEKYASVETSHYPAATHLTSHGQPCTWCHYQDLKTEHAKASVNVNCVNCHELSVDKLAGPWNKTCDQCHMDMHDDKPVRHASVNPACTTSGCHGTDVSGLHFSLPGGGCQVCHTSPDQAPSALVKDCMNSGCHGVEVPYHESQTTSHTAEASPFCGRCHDKDTSAGVNIEPVHKNVCATCHNNPTRVPDVLAKTAECASCHATSGTDYHKTMNSKHTFGAMDASCVASGCHVAKTLPEEHARFAGASGRYTQYVDSCALCHENTNSTRINWATASADCSTCHTVHGEIEAIHAAPDSQACVDCHETASVLDLHGTSRTASCAYCHNATTVLPASTKCVNCHSEYSTVDPAHYPVASHDATAEAGCNQCHYKDMKAEHFKTTVAVSCVACHENEVDAFATPWDKTCSACHPTRHGDQQTKHVSTNTSCSGSGCHDISNVATLHGVVGGPGCGACHVNPATPATTTNCTAAGCHASVGTNHHAAHDSTAVNPAGCKGCHFMYLDDEHAALNLTCATCHSSTNTVVQNAIKAGDIKCLTCHPDSPHNARQTYEFNPKSSSVHRVSSDLPGMQSAFTVNGARYTWTLPAAATFLKTGWAVDSVMTCESCHTYTGSTGPHGSAMKVNIDPAYPTAYSNGTLSPSTSLGMTTGIICAKCHDLNGTSGSWSNIVHKEHDDRGMTEGGRCVSCHVSVPHGWKRPRLLGATTDPAGYATVTGGNIEFKLQSYTPNGWSKSDCYAACSSDRHPNQANPWPLVLDPTVPVATTGDIAGAVTDAATSAAVSGATVSVAGKTATTASNGTYSITGITGGTYTMTVTKTGYTTWSGSVTITNGATLAKNVSLSAGTSGGTNLALGKTFTASRYENSTYTPAKAGDDSETSYWWSNDTGGSTTIEWLRVDLGSSMSIDQTDIVWYGDYYAKEFRVYTSTNGYTWTQVYSTTTGVSGTSTVTFTARSARYVKIECRKTGTGRSNGYGIAELRVFQ